MAQIIKFPLQFGPKNRGFEKVGPGDILYSSFLLSPKATKRKKLSVSPYFLSTSPVPNTVLMSILIGRSCSVSQGA